MDSGWTPPPFGKCPKESSFFLDVFPKYHTYLEIFMPHNVCICMDLPSLLISCQNISFIHRLGQPVKYYIWAGPMHWCDLQLKMTTPCLSSLCLADTSSYLTSCIHICKCLILSNVCICMVLPKFFQSCNTFS